MSYTEKQLEEFKRGYVGAMEWLTVDCPDQGHEFKGHKGYAHKTELLIDTDCERFLDNNLADLKEVCALYSDYNPNAYSWSSAGHDFWLTRNGHGAGFWDRDLGEIGDRLTASCENQTLDLVKGDDGKLYLEG